MAAMGPQQLHEGLVHCRTSWGASALEASRLGWLKATLRLWETDLRDSLRPATRAADCCSCGCAVCTICGDAVLACTIPAFPCSPDLLSSSPVVCCGP